MNIASLGTLAKSQGSSSRFFWPSQKVGNPSKTQVNSSSSSSPREAFKNHFRQSITKAQVKAENPTAAETFGT